MCRFHVYNLLWNEQAQQLFQRDAQTITPEALESVKAALANSEIEHKAEAKKKAIPRKAAGQSWEDPTLAEWPESMHAFTIKLSLIKLVVYSSTYIRAYTNINIQYHDCVPFQFYLFIPTMTVLMLPFWLLSQLIEQICDTLLKASLFMGFGFHDRFFGCFNMLFIRNISVFTIRLLFGASLCLTILLGFGFDRWLSPILWWSW